MGTMEINPKKQKYVIKFQRENVIDSTPSALYQMDWLIALNSLPLKTSTVD